MKTFSRTAAVKQLDLTPFWKRLAQTIINDMRQAIRGKYEVTTGAPVRPNKPSTVKRKGFDHRMVDTGAFVRNAYTYRATKRTLSIGIKSGRHPGKGGASYAEIAAWNQRGHDAQSVAGASQHFGMSDDREELVHRAIAAEVMRQLNQKLVYKAVIRKVV